LLKLQNKFKLKLKYLDRSTFTFSSNIKRESLWESHLVGYKKIRTLCSIMIFAFNNRRSIFYSFFFQLFIADSFSSVEGFRTLRLFLKSDFLYVFSMESNLLLNYPRKTVLLSLKLEILFFLFWNVNKMN